MRKNLLVLMLFFLPQILLLANVKSGQQNDSPQVIISDPGVTVYLEGIVKIDAEVLVVVNTPQVRGAEITLTQILDNAFMEPLFFTNKGLALIDQHGLTFSRQYSPTASLYIVGEASPQVYQQILREVTYSNSQVPPTPGDRLATYIINDSDGNESQPSSRIIRVELPPVEVVELQVTNVPSSGIFGIGQIIDLEVRFSDIVFVDGGTPYIILNIGGVEVRAEYVSGSGTETLKFAYMVEEGQLDMEGVSAGNQIVLNGTTLLDKEDRTLEVGLNGGFGQILVDGIRPYVERIELPADGTYGFCAGDLLSFSLVFNETVTYDFSNGLPTLQIQLGSGLVTAELDRGASSSTSMVFNYVIQPNDLALEGIAVMSLELNGAQIYDIAQNAFEDLGLENAAIPATDEIRVDTRLPETPVVLGITEDTGVSDSDGITSAQNLLINGSGQPNSTVMVFVDGNLVGETTSGDEGQWSFDYTSVTLEEGVYSLTAQTVNEFCAESEMSDPFLITIDTTPPVVNLQSISISLGSEGSVTLEASQLDDGTSDNTADASALVFTVSPNTFTCDDLGEQEVTVTVTDLSGNSTTESVLITVVDETPPSVQVQDLTLSLGEDGTVTLTVEELDAMVEDNCGVDAFELDKELFGCEDVGEHEVTLTVTDNSGNESQYTFTVTVVDDLHPVFENVPEDRTVGVDEDGNYALPDFTEEISVLDNCGIASIVQMPAAGVIISGFDTAHQVDIVATDVHGNETRISFTLTLVDNSISEIVETEFITVPWNTQIEDLPLPEFATVILRNGNELQLEVNWDISNYSAMEPGLYQNTGEWVLTDGVFNPQNLHPTINIMVEDKPLPLDIEMDSQSFEFDLGQNRSIGAFHTIDPSDDIHTYALVEGAAENHLFRIVEGNLFWNTEEEFPGRREFTITVSSTDRMGNVITKTFTITRIFPPLSELRIVNVFSPNGDGINDTWGVEVLSFYGNVRIMVFERSGKRVYYSTDPFERWDGKHQGQEVVSGTYYYIIEVVDTKEVHRSALTILRD